jgi:hypothetical protein
MKPRHDAEVCQQIEHLLHAQADEQATPFFPQAIDALSQLAASGDSNAQFYLGKCHSFGYGCGLCLGYSPPSIEIFSRKPSLLRRSFG